MDVNGTIAGFGSGATLAESFHWCQALGNSFAMILATELGDKTFFIAALLAMRHQGARRYVFLGAYGALVAMTFLSAGIGLALPALLSPSVTHWLAVVLFMYFGSSQLYAAIQMLTAGEGMGPSGELEEVAQELKDEGVGSGRSLPVLLQALTLTFAAEWGDKSQLGTVALASANSFLGVTLGGILGHCACTGLAVLGGRVLAARISERAVLGAAGALFLVFAIHGVVSGP